MNDPLIEPVYFVVYPMNLCSEPKPTSYKSSVFLFVSIMASVARGTFIAYALGFEWKPCNKDHVLFYALLFTICSNWQWQIYEIHRRPYTIHQHHNFSKRKWNKRNNIWMGYGPYSFFIQFQIPIAYILLRTTNAKSVRETPALN